MKFCGVKDLATDLSVCAAVATHVVTSGCKHEHLGTTLVCSAHVVIVQTDIWVCIDCEAAPHDAHICVITQEIQELEKANA